MNRVNEISFNSSLMREMRAIHFVTKLIDGGKISNGGLKKMIIHAISADEVMPNLGVASKLNADWGFLIYLRDQRPRPVPRHGSTANYERLGRNSTVDIPRGISLIPSALPHTNGDAP